MGSFKPGLQKSISEVFGSLSYKQDVVIRRLVGPKTARTRRQIESAARTFRPQNPLIPPGPGFRGAPSQWWQQTSAISEDAPGCHSDSIPVCKSGPALGVLARNATSLLVLGLCIGTAGVLLTASKPPRLPLACISFAMYALGLLAGTLSCLKKLFSGQHQKTITGLVIITVVMLAIPAVTTQSSFLLSLGVLLTMSFVGLFVGRLR